MRSYSFLIGALLVCGLASCKDEPKQRSETTKKDVKPPNIAETIFPFSDTVTKYLKEIERTHMEGEIEACEAANAGLLAYLKDACSKQPALLNTDFPHLVDLGLVMINSVDRKLRIYYWNTQVGGTMRYYNALMQYEAGVGSAIYVLNDIAEGDIGAAYPTIHTIGTKNRGTVYLVESMSFGSSRDITETISAYAIRNGKLQSSFGMFKTATRTLTDISLYYDRVFSEDEATGELKDSLHLSEDKMTLYIPVVEPRQNAMTGRQLIYRFDGNYFVFDKTAN